MTSDMNAFHHNVYEQSFRDIRSLNKKLPEETILSLAREVLRQLADRARAVEVRETPSMVESVTKLARFLISDDPKAGADMIYELQSEGASLDDVYLVYLAEAARKLGDWWNKDRISLVDVTVGTGRIYAIMRGLSPLYSAKITNSHKSALFTAVPGETHTIGVKMAADLFRQNGWTIDLKIGATGSELAQAIRTSPPRIVGLSAGGIHAVDALAHLIIAIRINSPATLILVSGQIVNEATDLVKLMGPDALVFDFTDVEAEMDRLWDISEPALALSSVN